jgi:hypothetical protein
MLSLTLHFFSSLNLTCQQVLSILPLKYLLVPTAPTLPSAASLVEV